MELQAKYHVLMDLNQWNLTKLLQRDIEKRIWCDSVQMQPFVWLFINVFLALTRINWLVGSVGVHPFVLQLDSLPSWIQKHRWLATNFTPVGSRAENNLNLSTLSRLSGRLFFYFFLNHIMWFLKKKVHPAMLRPVITGGGEWGGDAQQ